LSRGRLNQSLRENEDGFIVGVYRKLEARGPNKALELRGNVMSGTFNSLLTANTRGFLKHNFLTAVRFPGQAAGTAPFDLHHYIVNGSHVVTLDLWALPPHSDAPPLAGYWVPQGGSCVVPANPGTRRYVFTPDFSGCSILVDQINASQYRVYHIQGGANYLQGEYLGGPYGHGLGLAASMTFDDYGDAALPRGFAFLKHEAGRWWIYYQRQNGIGLGYNNGQFQAMGPQTVRGGARVPVADLTAELPRLNARHSRQDLPITRHIRVQRRMLPNDELW
jgi:hypothetical protein